MGCLKNIKPALREIRAELEPAVMEFAGTMVTALAESVSDGKLTKQDARDVAVAAVKGAKQVSTAAAEIAVTLANRAVNKLGVEVEEAREGRLGDRARDALTPPARPSPSRHPCAPVESGVICRGDLPRVSRWLSCAGDVCRLR